MFTESDQIVHSREECIEEAAEALARCYERAASTTAPADVAEAV